MTPDESKTVLVAEDDYLVGEEIIRALKTLGWVHIIEVSDGLAAVEKTCSLRPDIALLDIKMPKLDGLEAAHRIQNQCPTPVVILTAYESEDFLRKAGEAGVSAYLTKPLRKSELERAMSLNSSISWFGGIVGFAGTGLLIQSFGLRPALAVGAGISLTAASLIVALQWIKPGTPAPVDA